MFFSRKWKEEECLLNDNVTIFLFIYGFEKEIVQSPFF